MGSVHLTKIVKMSTNLSTTIVDMIIEEVLLKHLNKSKFCQTMKLSNPVKQLPRPEEDKFEKGDFEIEKDTNLLDVKVCENERKEMGDCWNVLKEDGWKIERDSCYNLVNDRNADVERTIEESESTFSEDLYPDLQIVWAHEVLQYAKYQEVAAQIVACKSRSRQKINLFRSNRVSPCGLKTREKKSKVVKFFV